MKRPKTYARSGWSQSWMELSTLFVLTTIAVAHLFGMHWAMAISVSPFVMLGMLAAVVVLVETMWLIVIGVDKVGAAIGLRKSPLT